MTGYLAASLLSLAVLGAIVSACSLAVLTYRALLRRWMVFLIRLEIQEAEERRKVDGFTRWREAQSVRGRRQR